MQKLGVRLEVTEAVLNHVSGSRAGIVGVYQRHEFAVEKRQALDAWARNLLRLVDDKPGTNVVEMATARRRTLDDVGDFGWRLAIAEALADDEPRSEN